ncbi:protein OSCP1 isoform X4 [Lagopus muta]|nr:protein OSCP1 isoform X4 [Lagopus muta]
MTMAFKYQVLLCPRPKDILLVTFNHLDAIKDFICDAPGILNQVDETFRQLIEVYGCLSAGEFQLIRQTLLIFFQDMHIRVSIFLKDKVQNSNGRFVLPISGPVPWGTEVPGVIRMFNCNGDEVRRSEFTTGGNYVTPQREGSFELYGDRVLKLGTNMYSVSRPAETHTSGSSKTLASSAKENVAPNPLAKEELNFLARLLGGLEIKKPGGSETGFRLNLFMTDEEEEQAALTRPEELSYKVVNIEATEEPARRAELERILGDLEVAEPCAESCGKGEDLLALMDGLCTEARAGAQSWRSRCWWGTAQHLPPFICHSRTMEVSHSVKERTIAENSLVILLQGLHGHVTTVDLRDESTATGRVANVDAFMNMRLAQVTFTDRRGVVSQLDEIFVAGRNVRYVHIPDQVDIRATIERQLQAIHRVRYFGGRDKGRREFPRAKHK